MKHSLRTLAALSAASTLVLASFCTLPSLLGGANALAAAKADPKKMDKPKADKPPVTEESILKSIKGPANCDVTVMAMPPQVMYPTAVAATPNGEVYVAIDENGSLGKGPGKGRVVKVIDRDGDGKADQVIVVAKMDNPRGLYFDNSTSTLYVLHPPSITSYHVGPDGVADSETRLVSGISTEETVKSRGADHTTNGFRVAIDGWMYIAMGDFGALKAVQKDGKIVSIHGGGVMRIRLDGTGLEHYSHHQRNICDVAVSPTLDVFTRDNTNDGDNWNDRLSYIIPNGEYGYPSKFLHFGEEIVQPLADYGGGSPVGALFLDEPIGGPIRNGLYTVEWGNSVIDYHPLTATGAGYKAERERWMSVPRATDMDADAAGRIFVTSWANGGFSYSGDNVGFLLRVTPKGFKPAAVPDFKKITDDELVKVIGSPSSVARLAAQREILFRGKKSSAPFTKPLIAIAAAREASPAVRTAAIFTLKQLLGPQSGQALADLSKDDSIREFALRALGDTPNDSSAPTEPLVSGLSDKNPRVRLVAAWALGHLGRKELADQIIPLVADPDALVMHTAINALADLQAADACLKALDTSNPSLAPGLLRALQTIHDVKVVNALDAKLKTIQDPAIRSGIYRALARLHSREADWNGSWWGTRPDTSGPYFKTADWDGTAKVRQILQSALATEKPEIVRGLMMDLQKNKVDFPELTQMLVKMAAQDPSFKPVLLEAFAARGVLGDDQISMVAGIAASPKEEPATRIKALRLLQKNTKNPAAIDGLAASLGAILAAPAPDKDLLASFTEISRDTRLAPGIPTLVRIAEGPDATKRTAAYALLVNLANHKLLAKEKNGPAAIKAVDSAWATPERAASLLKGIAAVKNDAYNAKVSELIKSTNPEVASAATLAAKSLGLIKGAGGTASSETPVTGTTGGALIEKTKYEQVLAAVIADKGDAKLGGELFVKVGCTACHTTSVDEQPKGPFLGGIAIRYTRPELVESVLKPSAKISQGFETQWFKTTDDEDYDGFVVREAGDEVEIRNIIGQTNVIKKKDIKERGKRDTSIMPVGLMDKYTSHDLASIMAFLETTKAGK